MKRVIMTVALVALIGFGSAAYAQDVKEVKNPPEKMEKPEGAPDLNGEKPEGAPDFNGEKPEGAPEINGERPERPEMNGENADGTAPEPPKGPKDKADCPNKDCDKATKETTNE